MDSQRSPLRPLQSNCIKSPQRVSSNGKTGLPHHADTSGSPSNGTRDLYSLEAQQLPFALKNSISSSVESRRAVLTPVKRQKCTLPVRHVCELSLKSLGCLMISGL
jgi:hypothetical protein